jgi:hypothetical protein
MKKHQNYFLYQIANADIRHYPWTHVLFDEIFCSDHYNLILENLPSESHLIDITKVKKHPIGYSNNRLILDDYDNLPSDQNLFWTNQRDAFLDGKLKDIIVKKFWTHIVDRVGHHIGEVDFYDSFQLTKDKKGYMLRAHPDAFDKVFTIVINLPGNSSSISMGTIIYNNDRDVVYKSKYLPNTGFGVFRSDNSYHGVEETVEDRWTIQYTVWGKNKD